MRSMQGKRHSKRAPARSLAPSCQRGTPTLTQMARPIPPNPKHRLSRLEIMNKRALTINPIKKYEHSTTNGSPSSNPRFRAQASLPGSPPAADLAQHPHHTSSNMLPPLQTPWPDQHVTFITAHQSPFWSHETALTGPLRAEYSTPKPPLTHVPPGRRHLTPVHSLHPVFLDDRNKPSNLNPLQLAPLQTHASSQTYSPKGA